MKNEDPEFDNPNSDMWKQVYESAKEDGVEGDGRLFRGQKYMTPNCPGMPPTALTRDQARDFLLEDDFDRVYIMESEDLFTRDPLTGGWMKHDGSIIAMVLDRGHEYRYLEYMVNESIPPESGIPRLSWHYSIPIEKDSYEGKYKKILIDEFYEEVSL